MAFKAVNYSTAAYGRDLFPAMLLPISPAVPGDGIGLIWSFFFILLVEKNSLAFLGEVLFLTLHNLKNSIVVEIIYSSVRPQHLERDHGNCISHKSSYCQIHCKKWLILN